MRNWFLAAAAALLSVTAAASELDSTAVYEPAASVLTAGPADKIKEKEEAKDAEAEERMKALDEARKGRNPRVVVLQWNNTDTDFNNETLQRNVRTRIARPDATFYPSIDLYQVGRREPAGTIAPTEEHASVPDDVIANAMNAVHDIETVPWNAMSEQDWGLTARNLRSFADETIWFVDRPELRGPLFHLYVQIGRAAENQNSPMPPYYETVGGQAVNYYWYLAGAMAHEEPALMSEVTNPDMYASIDYYKQMLDGGRIRKMTLAFSQQDQWDPKAFAGEYKVFVNGIERLISDPNSLLEVPPGRIDVYLARADGGHSLSDRLNITRLEDKIYFVRDVARKRMGLDLIDQLMEHPNECTPDLDGETFRYINIYAKLHPGGEIYVAIPEAGNPNKVMLWRFDRKTGMLQKVLDDIGGYPLHFAVMGGFGAAFGGASYEVTGPDEAMAAFQDCLAVPGSLPNDCASQTSVTLTPKFKDYGVPLWVQVRVHYARAFMAFGWDSSPFLGDPNDENATRWSEAYQTQDGHQVVDSAGDQVLKERLFNRTLWTGGGAFFGKDGVLGMGPRLYGKVGWNNSPHVIESSLHGGLTMEPPGIDGKGRRRMVADIDLFVGVLSPFGNTTLAGTGSSPLFGIAVGGGMVF